MCEGRGLVVTLQFGQFSVGSTLLLPRRLHEDAYRYAPPNVSSPLPSDMPGKIRFLLAVTKKGQHVF